MPDTEVKGDGIVYDRTAKVLPAVENFAKCVVHIRPHKDWKGEDFGFDWMRIDDSHIKGDMKYAENMGKYWIRKAGSDVAQPNANSFEGSFKKDAAMYKKLTQSYFKDPSNIVWKRVDTSGDNELTKIKKEADFKYFVPVMTLRKGKTAKLNLIVEYLPDTTKDLPIRIDVKKSTDKYFTLKPTNNPITAIKREGNKKNNEFPFEVTCNETFFEEQFIAFEAVYVGADGKEKPEYCGFVRILPNLKKRILKVVFIELKFTATDGTPVKGEVKQNEIDEIRKILNQAMVDLEYDKITHEVPNTAVISYTKPNEANIILGKTPTHENYKMTNLANIILKRRSPNGWFTDSVSLWRGIFNEDGGIYSNEIILKKYKYHIPIVVLGYECKDTPEEGRDGSETKGVTTDLGKNGGKITLEKSNTEFTPNTQSIILFKGRLMETTAHEILHAAGLLHTFSSDQEYTYTAKKTENIMDYSHMAIPPIPRINTYHWQWKVLWEHILRMNSLANADFETAVKTILTK